MNEDATKVLLIITVVILLILLKKALDRMILAEAKVEDYESRQPGLADLIKCAEFWRNKTKEARVLAKEASDLAAYFRDQLNNNNKSDSNVRKEADNWKNMYYKAKGNADAFHDELVKLKAEFLDYKFKNPIGETKTVHVSPLTREDVRTLMSLVHPDKHGGKESATKMFQLLNGMRDK